LVNAVQNKSLVNYTMDKSFGHVPTSVLFASCVLSKPHTLASVVIHIKL